MTRSCMTSLNSYQSQTCLFLGQENFHSYATCFALSQSSFADPYETFVMLLKSRSRTHRPQMHYSYTGDRRKNMLFIQIHQKKYFTPILGVNTKTCLIGFHPPNKCSKFLLLSLKSFYCRKEAWAMQKLFIKKRKKS